MFQAEILEQNKSKMNVSKKNCSLRVAFFNNQTKEAVFCTYSFGYIQKVSVHLMITLIIKHVFLASALGSFWLLGSRPPGPGGH
jgi:hypothetical protein